MGYLTGLVPAFAVLQVVPINARMKPSQLRD